MTYEYSEFDFEENERHFPILSKLNATVQRKQLRYIMM